MELTIHAPMALPPSLGCCYCLALAALLCLCIPFCKSDDAPVEQVPDITAPTRSLQCFEDGQVYSCCEGPYRLGPAGVIGVPVGMVGYYCDGGCLVETENVLNCVAGALDGFRFFNGATVEDVRYALRRGCSHGFKRGDFNDLEPQGGDYPDIYGDYGGGNKLAIPMHLLTLGGAWLLLGH